MEKQHRYLPQDKTNHQLIKCTHSHAQPTIIDITNALAKKGYQTKIFTGYRDVVNGYGWHVVHHVEICETVEYCDKCRMKHGVNHYENETNEYVSPHRHNRRYELKTLFNKEYVDNININQVLFFAHELLTGQKIEYLDNGSTQKTKVTNP